LTATKWGTFLVLVLLVTACVDGTLRTSSLSRPSTEGSGASGGTSGSGGAAGEGGTGSGGKGSEVTIDCGDLTPNLRLTCLTGKPDTAVQNTTDTTTYAIAPFPEVFSQRIDAPCDIGPTSGDPGDELRASIQAECKTLPTDAMRWQHQLTLIGSTERKCGEGQSGSGAGIYALWATTLRLSDGDFRIDVDARSPRSYPDNCFVSVDAIQGDPIATGESHLSTGFFQGPRTISITLDCMAAPNGTPFLGSSCVGYTPGNVASPAEMDETLVLTISTQTYTP
jgi:hypothetical protein